MKSSPSVRYNVIANFTGRAWAALFSLALVPVYIKLLGVEVYALLGILMSLTALLSLLDMGLSSSLSRELSRLSAVPSSNRHVRDLVRTFETVYWGIGVSIGITVAALAPFLSKHWIRASDIDHAIVEQVLVLMAMSITVQWAGALYAGGLVGLQRQVELNILRSVMVLVQHGGGLLVLFVVSRSIVAFFLWQAFVGLITTIALGASLWKRMPSDAPAKFDVRLLLENRGYAMGVTGISIVTIILTQLDKVVLSKMLTLEMFGYYMVAFNVSNALHNLVTPISTALLPKFTQLVALGDNDKLVLLYHQGCQLLSVLVLPISATLAFFSKEVLSLWLPDTDASQNAYKILTLLMVGTALNALMTLPYTLQLAHGWTRLAFYKNVIAVILLVPLMVWMVHRYQALGAAWVWVILNAAYLLSEVPIMHRHLLKGEMSQWYKEDIIRPIVIVASIGLLSRMIVPVDGSTLVIVLGLVAATGLSLTISALASNHLSVRILKIIPS